MLDNNHRLTNQTVIRILAIWHRSNKRWTDKALQQQVSGVSGFLMNIIPY